MICRRAGRTGGATPPPRRLQLVPFHWRRALDRRRSGPASVVSAKRHLSVDGDEGDDKSLSFFVGRHCGRAEEARD